MKARVAVVALVLIAITAILFGRRQRKKTEEAARQEEKPRELKGKYSSSAPSGESIAGDPLLAWPSHDRADAWFSKDGAVLTVVIRGSDEHVIEEYDVAKRELVSVLRSKGGKSPPDAGAIDAGTVRQARATFREASIVLPSETRAEAWTPDFKKLAIVLSNAVLLWSKESGLVRLGGPPLGGSFICSPSGRMLITSDARLVELATGRVTPVEHGGSDRIFDEDATFRHDEAEIAIGIRMGRVARHDTKTGKPIAPPTNPPADHKEWQIWGAQGDLAFARLIPYGRQYDVFEIESGKHALLIDEISHHTEGYAWSALRAADKNRVAVSLFHNVRVWTLPNQTPVTFRSDIDADQGTFRLDGSRLVISGEGKVERWDVETKTRTSFLKLPYEHDKTILRDGVSHDGQRFLLGSGEVASFEGELKVAPATTLLRPQTRDDWQSKGRYSVGCFGPGDATAVFGTDGAFVLHHFANKKTLALYMFVVGAGVEMLATTSDGKFDAEDSLLDTVWLEHEGKPRRASSFPERRVRGLLADFWR